MRSLGRVVFYYLALTSYGASVGYATPNEVGRTEVVTPLCGPGVAAKGPDRKHGAQEAPPSLDIRFEETRFITVGELPTRPEIALPAFAGFSAEHPGTAVTDTQARAERTNIMIPVSPRFPLDPDTVALGIRDGYFFYYPFKERAPYQRYENPAFRAIISMDAMMQRLSESDFVTQVRNKSHMAPKDSKPGAPKTESMFRVSFNERSNEVFEAAANADRLARDPKTKQLLLRDGQPYFTQETWITPETIELYKKMKPRGEVFTVAVWRTIYDPNPREVLAGGAIGLCIDGFYSSETLFTNHDPMPGFKVGDSKNEIGNGVAGKLAIFAMFDYLESQGVKWVDAQTVNDTTGRMSAQYIPRAQYMPLLEEALANPLIVRFPSPQQSYVVRFNEWKKETLAEKLRAKVARGESLLLVSDRNETTGEDSP